MKMLWMLGLPACVLLASGLATASTFTVQDTLDYTDNDTGSYYFLPPDVTMDHSPYFRMSLEDWDWTHSVVGKVPADANGIKSATVSIYAWDVDTLEGEVDVIYANGVRLGTLTGMAAGQERVWTTTVFTLPSRVVDELWRNKEVTIFIDIDRDTVGDRVDIGSSTLTVNYNVTTGGVTDPNVSVYRFWSPTLSAHFYTTSEDERDNMLGLYPDVWTYEGIAYRAFGAATNDDLKPVYRFWSGALNAHFYTITEAEKDWIIRDFSHVWTLEGVAFYAYPAGSQPAGASPVYRFWSGLLSRHFYTINEQEMQGIVNQYSYVWNLEGVAWYAFK